MTNLRQQSVFSWDTAGQDLDIDLDHDGWRHTHALRGSVASIEGLWVLRILLRTHK